MAVPKSTIWDIEPHTIAKHKILESYLKAWFPILSSWNGRINYIDGFAGPGKYSKGELGSPIIALNVAKNHSAKLRNEINFVFIEENEKRIENLVEEIKLVGAPANFKTDVIHGEFHSVIGSNLDKIESNKQTLAPTFVFIDPFGHSGIPFKIIQRLLQIPSVEVFITFNVNSINRFITDNQNNESIIELFGSKEVVDIIAKNTGDKRYDVLRKFYQKQLLQNAKFVRYFSMKDSDNKPIYDLFFATNHPLGNVRMKEAMWNVDKEGHYRFSDATNQFQTFLFHRDTNRELFKILKEKYNTGKYQVKVIREFVENETPFLVKHLKECLKYAEIEKLIEVDVNKSDGQKRRKATFPDEVMVNFK
ncbi:MAG: three-Cys-motif partner protein TcmP [Chlorobi bacterium]|nr:three-Cys-motif partner protein TcmP [Chlorobiota bacterium]MCI0716145.1 three-Cys-motif partner protein TcmP [Chlorobiota bacterium]